MKLLLKVLGEREALLRQSVFTNYRKNFALDQCVHNRLFKCCCLCHFNKKARGVEEKKKFYV